MSTPKRGRGRRLSDAQIAELARRIVASSRPPPRAGYDIDGAWSVAMRPGGSASVVNLAGGGYAVPLERSKEIAPPSRTVPIRARVPSGVVSILPTATHGVWRIIG